MADFDFNVIWSSLPFLWQGLQLSLLHPTRDRHDRHVRLRGAGLEYSGELRLEAAGLWHVRLEPEDGQWRLTGRLQVPGESSARLLPNRR